MPLKVKIREGHKKDKRKEVKMAIKKEKNSNAKVDWTDNEFSFLTDMLKANTCVWDVKKTGYTNCGIKEIAYTKLATFLVIR